MVEHRPKGVLDIFIGGGDFDRLGDGDAETPRGVGVGFEDLPPVLSVIRG